MTAFGQLRTVKLASGNDCSSAIAVAYEIPWLDSGLCCPKTDRPFGPEAVRRFSCQVDTRGLAQSTCLRALGQDGLFSVSPNKQSRYSFGMAM